MDQLTHLIDIEQFQQFDNMELLAKTVVEGFITGLHRSPFHGFSVEFSEHRQYNDGEPTRHVDWKLYGKTDKLFVKQYEAETNLRCQLVIDTSSSMLFPYKKGENFPKNKLSFAAYCASAIVYMMKRQRDASGLSLFSEEINFHAPARLSSVHLDMIYAELGKLVTSQGVSLQQKTNSIDAIHEIAERINKRSMVILFSDMIGSASDDELFQALQHLRYNQHEVIVFHVTDHKHELDFSYSNRPHKFIDLETGEQLRVKPQELRSEFERMSKEAFNEFKLRCGQYHIDVVEADINDSFSHVLQQYLIKRGQVG